jgi:hypothetical protein
MFKMPDVPDGEDFTYHIKRGFFWTFWYWLPWMFGR